MAEWSQGLPLTAHCLSTLTAFKSRMGHVDKVANDLGLGGGFCHIGFLNHL